MAISFRSNRTPIGVDLAGRLVNAVQLGQARNGWSIEAATSVRRLDASAALNREEVTRIMDVLERQGFRGRRVVLAMPREHLYSSVVELPPKASGAPHAQICRVELAASRKCDPNSLETAHWELPRSMDATRGLTAMAVGCPRETASSLLDAMEDAGFDVIGLDVQAWALSRMAAIMRDDRRGMAALVNIEWGTANLVVTLDGTVVFERFLGDAGASTLHGNLMDELGLDGDVVDYLLTRHGLRPDPTDEHGQEMLLNEVRDRVVSYLDALASEMRLSLAYITQEYMQDGIECLIATGEGAAIPGLTEELSRASGLKVTVARPTTIVKRLAAGIADTDTPALATAFGLALYPED